MFKAIKIGQKIGLGFGFVMALLAVAIIFGVFGLMESERGVESYTRMAAETQMAESTRSNILKARISLLEYLDAHQPEHLETYQTLINNAESGLQSKIAGTNAGTKESTRLQLLEQTLEQVRQYQSVVAQMAAQIEKSDQLIMEHLTPRGEEMSATMAEVIQTARDEDNTMVMFYAAEVQQALMAARLYAREYLESHDQRDFNRALMYMENDVPVRADELNMSIEAAYQRVRYSNYQSESSAYIEALKQLNRELQTLKGLAEELNTVELGVFNSLEQITKAVQKRQDELGPRLQEQVESSIMLLTTITLVALVIGVLFSIYMSRSISKPLKDAVNAARSLAEGRLTVRLESKSKDEIGELLLTLGQTAESLKQMIGQISNASDDMSCSTKQLSGAATRSLEGISRQQAETDQVAAAVEQMATSVSEVADNATQAADAAEQANQEAVKGYEIVSQTQHAIQQLASSVSQTELQISDLEKESINIGGILDVIRGIAEQTNLLALNAAIEAARAGDHGRGFAVVADEVRGLAQRTQHSTQEIQNLIERLQTGAKNAVHSMQEGREQAELSVDNAVRAGSALEAITDAVATITQMNTQIACAAHQQSQVAEKISQNVTNVRDVTEKNARSASETTAASQEINQTVAELQQMVSRFAI